MYKSCKIILSIWEAIIARVANLKIILHPSISKISPLWRRDLTKLKDN